MTARYAIIDNVSMVDTGLIFGDIQGDIRHWLPSGYSNVDGYGPG
jgi:hypothetical protein